MHARLKDRLINFWTSHKKNLDFFHLRALLHQRSQESKKISNIEVFETSLPFIDPNFRVIYYQNYTKNNKISQNISYL